MSDLYFNCEEIEKGLMEMVIYLPNVSYDQLLNMPVTSRDTLVKAWNSKVQKEKQQT